MGFLHTWHFKKAYSDEAWQAIELDGLALLEALPKSIAAERKARIQARPSAMLRIGLTLLHAWTDRGPVHPTRSDGAFCGPEPHGARAFRFTSDSVGPTTRVLDEAHVANVQGKGWSQTMAHKHDRVLIGILCLAAERVPGNVWVESTDAEDAYFLACVDWAETALGRKLRVPDGLEFSVHRNAASMASIQAEALGAHVPTSSTPTSARAAPRL